MRCYVDCTIQDEGEMQVLKPSVPLIAVFYYGSTCVVLSVGQVRWCLTAVESRHAFEWREFYVNCHGHDDKARWILTRQDCHGLSWKGRYRRARGGA